MRKRSSISCDGESGGRLVHDDDRRIVAKRAGDLDHVLLRDRQLLQRCVGVEIGLDALEERASLACASRSSRPGARARHMAHEDVLGDAELVEHHRFLVDGGDAGRPGLARRGEAALTPPTHEISPSSGVIDAGQDLDQSRFAGAVLADQRRHLAGIEVER